MEAFEQEKKSNNTDADNAELKFRAFERNQNPNSLQESLQPSGTKQEDIVDTAQENRSKQDGNATPTLMERAQGAVVLGAAGAILMGSSFLLRNEIMENHVGVDRLDGQDISQTQVIERPVVSQDQFIVEEKPYAIMQEKPEATPSAQADLVTKQQKADWWRPVPEYSQHDLTYKGANTEYGCVPTSTSMILDYWHQQNQENLTVPAQDLLNINVDQGEFNKYGMSSSNIHNEVGNLGYDAQDYTNSDLNELKTAVADGPVIAVVKLGMKADGTNHAVVVTGISNQNEVRVNDPWTGKSQTYSWDQFSKSWGSYFGKDAPKNSFTTIRPRQSL